MYLQLSDVLKMELNCTKEYLENLSKKLQLIKIFRSLTNQILLDSSSLIYGLFSTNRNLYAFWNEHILMTSNSEALTELKEIENILNFPFNSDCHCSVTDLQE